MRAVLVPPTPFAGPRAVRSRGARLTLRLLAVLAAACLAVMLGEDAALAGTGTLVATGLTESPGAIVAPDGSVWVSDVNGLCRVTPASVAGPGTVEPATCVDGAGQPAFLDPNGVANSGDEIVLIPAGGAKSTAVHRLSWDPASSTFTLDPTLDIDVGLPRPLGLAMGVDGHAYVLFTRDSTIEEIPSPGTADAGTVQVVGHTSSVRGASAIAAGRDALGAAALYFSETTGGISILHPNPASPGTAAVNTGFGIDGETFAGMDYDTVNNVLYAGTDNGFAPGQVVDMVKAFKPGQRGDVAPTADGYSSVIGVSVRPGGRLFVIDDPTGGVTGGARMFDTGLPGARILDGPSGAVNTPAPTFSIAGDTGATLECAVTPAGGTPAFAPCSAPTFTSAPLADGGYTFAVRAVSGAQIGFPATRAFTVDTVAPTTTVDAPAAGATTSASPTFAFHASEGAVTFACRVDDQPFAGCGSPHTVVALAPGGHTFQVRATDAAGNLGPIATLAFGVPAPAGLPQPPGIPATPPARGVGAGGGAPAGGQGGAGAADLRAPAVSLAFPGGRARLAGRRLAVIGRCDEACSLSVQGTVAVRRSAQLYRLRPAAGVLHRAGSRRLVLRLPKTALRPVRRALRSGRVVTARLRLTAVDNAGNARSRTLVVRLR